MAFDLPSLENQIKAKHVEGIICSISGREFESLRLHKENRSVGPAERFSVLENKTAHKTAHNKKAKRKRFNMRFRYKNIHIVRAKNGDWRVTYEYEYPDRPGKFKKFYVRDGINYVKDLEQREIEAQKLKILSQKGAYY